MDVCIQLHAVQACFLNRMWSARSYHRDSPPHSVIHHLIVGDIPLQCITKRSDSHVEPDVFQSEPNFKATFVFFPSKRQKIGEAARPLAAWKQQGRMKGRVWYVSNSIPIAMSPLGGSSLASTGDGQ